MLSIPWPCGEPRTFAYSLPFGTAIGSGRTLNKNYEKICIIIDTGGGQ